MPQRLLVVVIPLRAVASRALRRAAWLPALALGALTVTSASCPSGPATLTMVREQVFSPRCSNVACHGGAAQGDLDLQREPHAQLVDVAAAADPSRVRVVPGDPEASLLFQVLQGDVGSVEQMPPGFQLPGEELDLVRRWIEEGALDN